MTEKSRLTSYGRRYLKGFDEAASGAERLALPGGASASPGGLRRGPAQQGGGGAGEARRGGREGGAREGWQAGAADRFRAAALSWYRLFARDFKGALAASERAGALAPDPVYATNRAHALMFLGRAREAKGLYLRYKGQPVKQGGKLWEDAILEDFKEFGKRGLKHPQIAEIEPLLAAK